METIWVKPEEVQECDRLGQIRNSESMKRGNKDAHGLKIVTPEDVKKDRIRQCVGVMAEYVAALMLTGDYEFTVNTYTAPDFMLSDGRAVEVKGSQRFDSLVVRPNAHCNDIYVHVYIELLPQAYVNGAKAIVTGWTTPYEARLMADVQNWWEDRQARGAPAIFVPLPHLRPMETLVEGKPDDALRCPGCTRRIGGCRR